MPGDWGRVSFSGVHFVLGLAAASREELLEDVVDGNRVTPVWKTGDLGPSDALVQVGATYSPWRGIRPAEGAGGL